MAVITSELEISSSLLAPKLFKAFSDFGNIAPKVDPQIYKAIEIIQGDGGVGTIMITTYRDGIPYTRRKSKVDAIDANNLTLSFTTFEGDELLGLLDSATHHAKFIPCADGGSIYKHTVVFNFKGDTVFTEEQINLGKEGLKNNFKAFEAYVNANPAAF